jgi:hypothetical protein
MMTESAVRPHDDRDAVAADGKIDIVDDTAPGAFQHQAVRGDRQHPSVAVRARWRIERHIGLTHGPTLPRWRAGPSPQR